jgi:hypothetical protein
MIKTLPKITLEDSLFIVNLLTRLPLEDKFKVENPNELLSDGYSLGKVESHY